MMYVIASLVLSGLALIIAFIGLVIFLISGKKVMTVFTEFNESMNAVSRNIQGVICQNTVDHEAFRSTLKQHEEKLDNHTRRINEHDQALRPKRVIKTSKNGTN